MESLTKDGKVTVDMTSLTQSFAFVSSRASPRSVSLAEAGLKGCRWRAHSASDSGHGPFSLTKEEQFGRSFDMLNSGGNDPLGILP